MFFDNSNLITFNCKKTVVQSLMARHYKRVTLDGTDIEWVSEIKHLEKKLQISCNDKLDCHTKTSYFIGYVNKLILNFNHLRGYVLNKLFKLYCCSFYDSQMWRLESVYLY